MLTAAGREPERERSARTEPLTEADAGELLGTVARLVICKGRKTVELVAGDAEIDDLKGPTGGFRAPLLLVDDTLVVGFNHEAIRNAIGRPE